MPLPIMRRTVRPRRFLGLLAVAALTATLSACGGSDSDSESNDTPESTKAGALSLQQAMASASRSIDAVRGTRDSLERMATSLQPTIAQTSDVIGVLTPGATESDDAAALLDAAREQRTFLQFAADASGARSASAATSTVNRAREAGRRASDAYAALARSNTDLAGLLPASTTFNTGRLRDAVSNVNKSKSNGSSDEESKPKSDANGSSGSGGSGTVQCGDGLSVNANTSCPFARNVADEYRATGGASRLEVYSPVTGIVYTMSCTDGIPVVCRGGNGAVVYIR